MWETNWAGMVVATVGGRTTRKVSTVLAVAPLAKVADMVQLVTPVAVGVPVIWPVVLLKERPVGRLEMLQELRDESVEVVAW